ncbi:MAG TPA: DUF4404 family protein [Steroidobacteraceae bacterium]|nr:DUF4404 family protein [Steroidobacteraceae bacterium]
MSDLKQQLSAIHDTLSTQQHIDDETRQQLVVLLADITRLLHPDAKSNASTTETLESVAARFDVDHPALSGAMRQLLDALVKAGI